MLAPSSSEHDLSSFSSLNDCCSVLLKSRLGVAKPSRVSFLLMMSFYMVCMPSSSSRDLFTNMSSREALWIFKIIFFFSFEFMFRQLSGATPITYIVYFAFRRFSSFTFLPSRVPLEIFLWSTVKPG